MNARTNVLRSEERLTFILELKTIWLVVDLHCAQDLANFSSAFVMTNLSMMCPHNQKAAVTILVLEMQMKHAVATPL